MCPRGENVLILPIFILLTLVDQKFLLINIDHVIKKIEHMTFNINLFYTIHFHINVIICNLFFNQCFV